MTLPVRFRRAARADLRSLYLYIAEQSGPARGWSYIKRIEAACRELDTMPNRGHRRDDLAPGNRTMSFEGRTVIACPVQETGVSIVRVFYAGKDYSTEDFPE